MQDPFDPNIAYVSYNRIELYRNDSWRTAGSTWAKIFDLATYNTVTGRSDTAMSFGDDLGQICLTIASEGYVGLHAMGTPEAAGANTYIHSHDRGDTWPTFVGDVIGGVGRVSLVSQKNADIIWVSGHTGGGSVTVKKSLDHGHSFSASGMGTHGLYGPLEFVFPTENNPNSLVVYAFATGFSNAAPHFSKTNNGGTSWTTDNDFAADQDLYEMEVASDNRSLVYANQVSGGNTNLFKSTDGGDTDSVTQITTSNYTKLAVLRSNRLYYLGGADPYVATSEDHVTLTSRRGNLTTVVGTPQSGGAMTVTVDFTT